MQPKNTSHREFNTVIPADDYFNRHRLWRLVDQKEFVATVEQVQGLLRDESEQSL